MHFTAFWKVKKQMILHGFVKLVRNQPRKQLLETNVLKTDARNTQKRLMKN